MTTKPTGTQQRMNAHAIDRMLSAMTWTRRAVLLITAITMVANYSHQTHTLAADGAGWVAWILPAPLDVLMLVIMKIGQLDGIPARNRRIARCLLLLPATASAIISFSGDGTTALRIVFAGLVAAIALGDYAVSLIKPDVAAMQACAETPATVDDVAAAELAAKRSAAARKAAATRAANKKAKESKVTRPRRPAAPRTPTFVPAAAPVSPAPNGTMVGGLWVPDRARV